jgi:hypothetical protein
MEAIKVNPNDYTSPFQCLLNNPQSYKAHRFAEAKKYVAEGMTLHVAGNGRWYGTFQDKGRSVDSYERLGYHSGANWFLEGYLREGGRVVFHGFKGITGEVTL